MIWLALVASCTEVEVWEPVLGPTAVFNPDGRDFFDTPWPSDARRDEDGTLSVAEFPQPSDAVLLEEYLARIDQLTGFGNNSPIYVRLTGPVDPLAMPTAESSLYDRDASIILVDVDPESPYRGERFPLQWEQNDYPSSSYMPEHLLAVAPVYGYPLRPATQYALILTTRVLAQNQAWAARLAPEHPDYDADLGAMLWELGLSTEQVSMATVFTTQNPLDELTRIADYLRQLPPAEVDEAAIVELREYNNYTAFEGSYNSPIFTEGTPPYADEGGGFGFDERGFPVVSRWDRMRLAVCTPHGPEPDNGWPVVIYQHGTGGDYRTFCNSNRALEVMNRLGAEGFVGLGIDQTLHGTRPGGKNGQLASPFQPGQPRVGNHQFPAGRNRPPLPCSRDGRSASNLPYRGRWADVPHRPLSHRLYGTQSRRPHRGPSPGPLLARTSAPW